jgi:hypothetical protein
VKYSKKKKKILARGAAIVISNLLRKYFKMKAILDIATNTIKAMRIQNYHESC